jgi:hypothetical protein
MLTFYPKLPKSNLVFLTKNPSDHPTPPFDVWEKTCSYQSVNGGGNLFTHRLKNRVAFEEGTPRNPGRTFRFVKHDGSSSLVEEASTVERLDLVLLMGFITDIDCCSDIGL